MVRLGLVSQIDVRLGLIGQDEFGRSDGFGRSGLVLHIMLSILTESHMILTVKLILI